ncbi:MAG: hypothetical protein O7F12_10530 [Nitrospirae bacterium]|nr:hypothetical protein [Nitrospirota bacterium]
MKRATPNLFDFTQFDISEDRGFLPAQDPGERLPQFPALEHLRTELPKLLTARQLRHWINQQEFLMPPEILQDDPETCRSAFRVLSFTAHGYVWEDLHNPAQQLPAVLAVPWCRIAKKLGRPPVLSYASYALENWRRLDSTKPIVLDNIVLIQNFLGGLDEEWFVLVHVDIEAKAGRALAGLVHAQDAAGDDDVDEVISQLHTVAAAQEAMCHTLDHMQERCDPYIYYQRVRPYIHGSKDNPALPHGLVYEGVEEFQGHPQQFRGETGAQSSIIPSLDAALGVGHAEDPLTHYLHEMRQYMPPRHRAFIEALEARKDEQGRPLLWGYARDRKVEKPELWKAYCQCVQLLARFRGKHLEYAASYIHHQKNLGRGNPTAVGTGGTPFMDYLKKHLEETQRFLEQ